jgi:hypothetical protein
VEFANLMLLFYELQRVGLFNHDAYVRSLLQNGAFGQEPLHQRLKAASAEKQAQKLAAQKAAKQPEQPAQPPKPVGNFFGWKIKKLLNGFQIGMCPKSGRLKKKMSPIKNDKKNLRLLFLFIF